MPLKKYEFKKLEYEYKPTEYSMKNITEWTDQATDKINELENKIQLLDSKVEKLIQKSDEDNKIIKELKIENLNFRIKYKKDELEKLVAFAKVKLNKRESYQLYGGEPPRIFETKEPDQRLHDWLETLLSSQKECLQGDVNASAREKLWKSKEVLKERLTSEEVENILGKQMEFNELVKQLTKLEAQNQQAQVIQKFSS